MSVGCGCPREGGELGWGWGDLFQVVLIVCLLARPGK